MVVKKLEKAINLENDSYFFLAALKGSLFLSIINEDNHVKNKNI